MPEHLEVCYQGDQRQLHVRSWARKDAIASHGEYGYTAVYGMHVSRETPDCPSDRVDRSIASSTGALGSLAYSIPYPYPELSVDRFLILLFTTMTMQPIDYASEHSRSMQKHPFGVHSLD